MAKTPNPNPKKVALNQTSYKPAGVLNGGMLALVKPDHII